MGEIEIVKRSRLSKVGEERKSNFRSIAICVRELSKRRRRRSPENIPLALCSLAGSDLRSRHAQKTHSAVLLAGCAVDMRSAAILTFSLPTRS